MSTIKVAVTGAAGQIGYSLLFRIASGEVFGPDQKVSLSLIEIEPAMEALEGVVMELRDCAFPLLEEVSTNTDLGAGFEDADWALLVGSVPRKAGMERKDLLGINGKIFVEQGKAIDANAKQSCRILVVGNPCNTNCWIASQQASRIPKQNWFAMTKLDENRARWQLADKAGVPVASVTNLAIWGNHSATQYPNVYQAKIDGKPVTEVISDEQWLQGEFLKSVQQRGAAIIDKRGSSSAASAANAVIDTVKSLVHGSCDNGWSSIAVISDGSYGVDEGLVFSYPLEVAADGSWSIVQGLELSAFSQEKIDATRKELVSERDTISSELNLG